MTSLTHLNWPPLRLPPRRLEELRAESSVADRNPLIALTAQVKVLAAGGRYALAHKLLQAVASEYPVADGELEIFRRLWPSAILAHARDLALSWLNARFRPTYHIGIEIAGRGLPVDVMNMRIRGDALLFQLSPELFEFHAGDMILTRWTHMFPLWDTFMRSSDRIDGNVAVNLLDSGSWPGLAFCDFRPGYYLIPDSEFLGDQQYQQFRADFRANVIAWHDRRPIAFWRGSTTGVIRDMALGWRGLPRVQLCEIAAANPDIIDAGITGVSQINDPSALTELESRNLMRSRVDPLAYQVWRYQIDIDGNSNAWEGFFLRLLTGSPVLKVASPFGYEQWYYDRLRPWVNFIPVAADMSDLVEKVTWLRANDDAARKIGEAGRALALSLDEREIARAIPVIAAAIRADAGGPLVDLRFGVGTADDFALRSGWQTPERDGAIAVASESHVTMPRPPGFGDHVLMAEVSITRETPRLMTIASGGTPIIHRLITGRMTVYGSLPRSLTIAEDEFDLTFSFQHDGIVGPEASFTRDSAAGVILHRIGVAAVDAAARAGYSDIDTMLAELNTGQPMSAVHDLGSARADLSLPPGAVGRRLRTFFGTVLYADRESGRVRHGPADTVPRNLFAIQLGNVTLLARTTDNGGHVAVGLRPEGPHAPSDQWTPWAGGGFARTFTMVTDGSETPTLFSLRAAGLFACAEYNGEFTLSRQQPAEWESFHFADDAD